MMFTVNTFLQVLLFISISNADMSDTRVSLAFNATPRWTFFQQGISIYGSWILIFVLSLISHDSVWYLSLFYSCIHIMCLTCWSFWLYVWHICDYVLLFHVTCLLLWWIWSLNNLHMFQGKTWWELLCNVWYMWNTEWWESSELPFWLSVC